ncbi:MAG: zinc-dependent metalloprotease, partial [Actinobacteria bacterium]|nr:zinc-dependent metalloprotease [Actinomycetota bacterium]
MSDDGPVVLDETVALWAARLVAPARNTDAAEVARLRASVTADLPGIDAAARAWSQLGQDLPPTECRVIGRIGWVRTNLTALRGAFTPLGEKMRGNRAVASRVLGAQFGALLGLLSTKVLGQFVLPFGGPGGGQLVLVGPNLLELGDEHGDLAPDIWRTVLLHEVTHRLQFDGTDWLGAHLRDLLDRYLSNARIDPAALLEAAGKLPQAIAAVRETGSIIPLVETVLTDEQLAVVDEAQGLMSLLEGHGNAAMFAGAEGVIERPDDVREALESRRSDATTRILTAVAGLELKRRQYREGETFVRTVLDERGVPGLNRAFAAPPNLPTAAEVRDPQAWMARVADA